MHMLAYNLIRKTIAIAASKKGVMPYQISFKGALQTLMNFCFRCSLAMLLLPLRPFPFVSHSSGFREFTFRPSNQIAHTIWMT